MSSSGFSSPTPDPQCVALSRCWWWPRERHQHLREVRKRSRGLHFPQTALDMFSGSAGLSADPATSSESSTFSRIPRAAAGWESWKASHSYPRSFLVGRRAQSWELTSVIYSSACLLRVYRDISQR